MDEEPLEGLQEAVGAAFEGQDVDELKADARTRLSQAVQEDAERRSQESQE